MPTDVWPTVLFGLVLLLGSIGLSYLPNLPPWGRQALRVLVSAGAGFLTYGLSGTIAIGGQYLGLTIRATAGLAVFVAVFYTDPPARIARSRGLDSSSGGGEGSS